ncbi:SymE family type I addiction module toxin [Solobacterium moorei]|uniref:SymE family type I addiction module toxin n=1 Tax=Solobacterium moorei TaxID=102148 RepID=UPI0009DB84F5|nr:hypothetical protein RGT18_01060 [Solobacterium moorei]
MRKNNRTLKVYGTSNNNRYHDTPTIMMKGKWLEKFGFRIGQRYYVDCHKDKLLITIES